MANRPFLKHANLIELSPGTGIALWAFRSCAMGITRCGCLPLIFSDLFGSDGPDVLRHILVLAQTIGHSGQRKLNLTYPNAQRVTHDEASLLRALEAAQSGRVATVESQLHWLLSGAKVIVARDTLNYVAEAFLKHGLNIDDPYTQVATNDTEPSTELSHRILRFVLK